MKRLTIMAALLIIGVVTAQAQVSASDANGSETLSAKRSHYGLICGAVQMNHYRITNRRYRMARNWADFEHTSAGPDIVVVQWRSGKASDGSPGAHVSRIISMRGSCQALVADEKGQYLRDICSRLIAYVKPSVEGSSQLVARDTRHRHVTRLHKHNYRHYVRHHHRHTARS